MHSISHLYLKTWKLRFDVFLCFRIKSQENSLGPSGDQIIPCACVCVCLLTLLNTLWFSCAWDSPFYTYIVKNMHWYDIVYEYDLVSVWILWLSNGSEIATSKIWSSTPTFWTFDHYCQLLHCMAYIIQSACNFSGVEGSLHSDLHPISLPH